MREILPTKGLSRHAGAVQSDFEARLVKQMRELSEQYPRWGYRTIHALLVEDGWQVNRKRVERLWREHELQVPPLHGSNGKKAGGVGENSAWNLPALRPGHIWSYDFASLPPAPVTAARCAH